MQFSKYWNAETLKGFFAIFGINKNKYARLNATVSR